MKDTDFPNWFQVSDKLSTKYQNQFYRLYFAHILFLIVLTGISLYPNVTKWTISFQIFIVVCVLISSLGLFLNKPDRKWYSARSLAESIRTITWRFVTRAEPFHEDTDIAKVKFINSIKKITNQNQELKLLISADINEDLISYRMQELRNGTLQKRKSAYLSYRIQSQLDWYKKNSRKNNFKSNSLFSIVIILNIIAVVLAASRLGYVDEKVWPTDIIVTAAIGLVGWIQVKKYSELSTSYSLTASEITQIKIDYFLYPINNEKAFSDFIGDTENAFSREHTQWYARKDHFS
ncbi:DUF4231 domain-containing protein [Acinetobacter sp. Ac_5812]|uniref:DUF4231 domain-containing protein n=1 Tax=Acinetobacter sp. Ac_5812 TaxID=1848937 RepID=UPI00148FFF2B|nr:DUF4231 domain-containing protein [Acinetobacter sp. Ac_5812]NNP67276.1 hypothetical protein [Acinetobacter sp. Ac_5812]